MASRPRPEGKGQGNLKKYVSLELAHPGTKGCGRPFRSYARPLHFGGVFHTENNTDVKRPCPRKESSLKLTDPRFSFKDTCSLVMLEVECYRSSDQPTHCLTMKTYCCLAMKTTHACYRLVMTLKKYTSTSSVSTLLTLTRFKLGEEGASPDSESDVPMTDMTVTRGRSTNLGVSAKPTTQTIPKPVNSSDGVPAASTTELLPPNPANPSNGVPADTTTQLPSTNPINLNNEVPVAPATVTQQNKANQGEANTETQQRNNRREVSTTPYNPHSGGVTALHWAPSRGAKLLGLTEFIDWVKLDDQVPKILRPSFARASPTLSGLIKTVVTNDEQLALVKAYFGGTEQKFILVSEFPKLVTIAEMKIMRLQGGEPRLLAPIQIGQLPESTRPSEVATMIKNRGEHPIGGEVSNLRKVGNCFEGRVWHPLKRAQILRNALSHDDTYIRLSPGQLGDNEVDDFACIIRNEGDEAETEDIQEYITQFATNVPEPLAIAQYRNPHTNTTIQKWIVCFGTSDQAKQFANSTSWVQEVKVAKLNVKPCRGPVVNVKSHTSKGKGGTLYKK